MRRDYDRLTISAKLSVEQREITAVHKQSEITDTIAERDPVNTHDLSQTVRDCRSTRIGLIRQEGGEKSA